MSLPNHFHFHLLMLRQHAEIDEVGNHLRKALGNMSDCLVHYFSSQKTAWNDWKNSMVLGHFVVHVGCYCSYSFCPHHIHRKYPILVSGSYFDGFFVHMFVDACEFRK